MIIDVKPRLLRSDLSLDMKFCSKIQKDLRLELEELLYLNSRQHLLVTEIERAVERFGQPVIMECGSDLEVKVTKDPNAQVLYSVARVGLFETLAGLMIYTRTNFRTLSLIHIAVHERFCFPNNSSSGERVCFLLIDELRSIAKRIRGIERIEMLYGRSGANFLAVKRERLRSVG